MKRKIVIELEFSDKLEKNLSKRGEKVDKFIGDLVGIYRNNINTMVIPLKDVDPKVKVTVFSPKQ